jgi:hypothetical protein
VSLFRTVLSLMFLSAGTVACVALTHVRAIRSDSTSFSQPLVSQLSAQAGPLDGQTTESDFYVNQFPATGGAYMGEWNATTAYPRYATVTHNHIDWIATNSSSNVEPHSYPVGTVPDWVQFDTSGAGLPATQADCAFFAAYAYVQSHSTSFTIPAGADLEFGSRRSGYDKNGDWIMPSNPFGYTISVHGKGRGLTVINQSAGTLNYMISQDPGHNPNIISQEITGITLNANLHTAGCLSVHGVRRSHYSEVTCFNPQQQRNGAIQYAMWIGFHGDSYELTFDGGLVRTPTYPGISPAFATAIVSGGQITSYTVTSPGAKLNSPIAAAPGLVTYWLGKGPKGNSWQPCSAMPDQPTYSIDPATGALNRLTPGANKGAGCGGTIYVRIQQAGTIPYAWFFGATDSTLKDISTSGDFTKACQFDYRGANHFLHEHPYCQAPVQIQANGSNWHDGTELDSPIQYGIDLQGTGDIFSSYMALWNGTNYYGAGEILIEPGASFTTIGGSNCGAGKQSAGGYAKFTSSTAGPLSNTSNAFPSGFTIQGAEPNCDGSNNNWGVVIPGIIIH